MKTKYEKNLNFGQRVKELFEQSGKNPSELCEAAGVNIQNYYDWKNKGAVPNAMIALRVAKFFGVTIEWLLTGENWQRFDKDAVNPLQERVDKLQERIENIKSMVKNA